MSDCECLKECSYFASDIMKESPTLSKLRQKEYCKGNNTKCARYMVFKVLGKGHVPADLTPYQTDRAAAIIGNAKKARNG